jgi:type IV secretory pathway VirB9-like protein
MITKTFAAMILILWSIVLMANTKIRRVIVSGDQIVTVKTALGIATIIQVPDRPNSVVVGDQDAFKVEYLDLAVTIKPLQPGAKTNIYIYTDWKRYNVELVSGSESVSDYVVYLENPKEKTEVSSTLINNDNINWSEFKKALRNGDISLETKRVAKLKNGILQIEFYLTSEKKQKINPEWIWLTQKNKTKPIHNLILSSLEISTGSTVQGILQILASDIESNESFKIEIRRNGISYLTMKKVDSWK